MEKYRRENADKYRTGYNGQILQFQIKKLPDYRRFHRAYASQLEKTLKRLIAEPKMPGIEYDTFEPKKGGVIFQVRIEATDQHQQQAKSALDQIYSQENCVPVKEPPKDPRWLNLEQK